MLKKIGIALLVVLSVGLVSGVAWFNYASSDTKVCYAKELKAAHVDMIRKIAKLGSDEQIEMFYTQDIFAPESDGNLLTNRGVYSWFQYEGKLVVDHATFAEISDVSPAYSTDWLEDTEVICTTRSDDIIVLALGNEKRRDREFVRRLNAYVAAHRPVKPAASNESANESSSEE